MILVDHQIREEVQKGNIVITPWSDDQLNPNSYNLRLADELAVYDAAVLDPKKKLQLRSIQIPKTGLLLYPNKLYLGRTVEKTVSHSHVPMIEGRSSIGRLGIFIHVTAGFGDIGFSGYWTLEIVATKSVVVYPEMEICQIFWHTTKDGALPEKAYKGKYQDNKGIQPSLIHTEFCDGKKA